MPAAEQVDRWQGADVRVGAARSPVPIAGGRVCQPVLEVADPFPEGQLVPGYERQHPRHPPVGEHQPQHRAHERAEPLVLGEHGGHPGQRGRHREGAAWIEEPVEVIRADLDDHRLEFRRRVIRQRPLSEAEVARAYRGERTVEPGLLTQPGDRRLSVGRFASERLPAAARSARSPGALQQDVITMLGEQAPVHEVVGEPAPVWGANEQRRARLASLRDVPVGNLVRPVRHRDPDTPLQRHRACGRGQALTGPPREKPYVPGQLNGAFRGHLFSHVLCHQRAPFASTSRTSFAKSSILD
jgi:hypothetical protein